MTGTDSVKLPRNSPMDSATIASATPTVADPIRGRLTVELIATALPYPDRLKLPLEP